MPECPPHPGPLIALFPAPCHPTKPTPGAERREFSFGKRPTGVRVALKMGFWESDGQTRSEALQICCRNLDSPDSPSRCRTIVLYLYVRHRRDKEMDN